MICLWFGKFKGRPLSEVDTGYLRWALREVRLSGGVRQAVALELAQRGVAAPLARQAPVPSCRCGCRAFVCTWQEDRRGHWRVRRSCSGCGAWLGFAPACAPYTTEADQRASTTPVLDALCLAEAEDVELLSDGQQVRLGRGWDRASPQLKDAVRQRGHLLASLLGQRRGATP